MRGVMRRAGASALAIALCAVGLAALPALASARVAYFTGATGDAEGYAAPVDLGSGSVGARIPVVTEGAPSDVAISPDGSTAYVAGAFDELVRIGVATDTEEAPVEMNGGPWRLAIAPDGKRAYATAPGEDNVVVFDLAAGTEIGAIPVGHQPEGIAVTPDGSRAYVVNRTDGTVSVIDLATDSVIGAPIPVGSEPTDVGVTPDGRAVYVVNHLGQSVSVIDVSTDAVLTTIPTSGVEGERIAISPDGSRAYVLSETEGVVPIDLATGTAGAAIPLTGVSRDVAILPDGSRAYLTHGEQQTQLFFGDLRPLDLATSSFGAGLPLSEEEFPPEALAIVPNQPPHAAFSASPESTTVGGAVAFDATSSTDPDGSVARYDWEFGDGTSAPNAGATPSHTYSKAGTYQVTLTTTDNEGCSTQLVFTGQTAYCNGSAVARATRTVTVASSCPTLKARANSFKPKIRPGHVVPGVRVRLATGAPARLTVRAKLLWKKRGKSHVTKLRKLSVDVRRWRRVRFPIPAKLRKALPLGAKVGVKLVIVARPRNDASCGATTTRRTLHVRVVKVFPNAVQAKRPR